MPMSCHISPAGYSLSKSGVFAAALALAVLLGFTQAGQSVAEPAALPALGADLSQSSVSGLSSGAYMAAQFHLAHADIVKGAGLVAGGPWGCAENQLMRLSPFWPQVLAANTAQAIEGCMADRLAGLGVGDPQSLAARARSAAGSGDIAPVADLAGDRVYLFSGGKDQTVAPALVRRAADVYRKLGLPETNIKLVENPAAGHAFLTEQGGDACGLTRSPFLTDCDYDQARDILQQIYGALSAPANDTSGVTTFDQRPYAPGSGDGLAEEGAVFVPPACRGAPGCRVHVVFHGCRQGREFVGDAFITGSGYLRWAATNKTMILFPQVKSSAVNPRGCWDWWGYTGKEFLSRDAPQIKAARAMLDRLAEKP